MTELQKRVILLFESQSKTNTKQLIAITNRLAVTIASDIGLTIVSTNRAVIAIIQPSNITLRLNASYRLVVTIFYICLAHNFQLFFLLFFCSETIFLN